MTTSLPNRSESAIARAPAAFWDIGAYWPAAALAAVAAAAVGIARSRSLSPPVRGLLAGGFGGVAALGFVRWQLSRHFTPMPDYVVEQVLGELEVRRYPKRLQAETVVIGTDWDEALDEGFRRLAGYIFGGNASKVKLAMTAPVTATSERIAMTSPVTSVAAAGGQRVAFVMPHGRALRSMPVPQDGRVKLREVPAHRVAALRFHGNYRSPLVLSKQHELLELVRAAALEIAGEPQFAGYDAPSTLPFLRRNEVWVKLA